MCFFAYSQKSRQGLFPHADRFIIGLLVLKVATGAELYFYLTKSIVYFGNLLKKITIQSQMQ